jgi:metallo-beta-lactamase family protein
MELTFHGAAREVTGSCHLIRVNGKAILLDAGLFQGRRDDVRAKNRALPLPVDEIAAVVLSHAHIDHAGRLPYLVKQGYRGPIFATSATKDLCRVMLMDSAHIQEKDAEFLAKRNRPHDDPLYGAADATATLEQMRGDDYDKAIEVIPGVSAQFLDAGHILGSASVVLEWREGISVRRLAFSGDIGRTGLSIIRDPVPPTDVDGVIMESTYGGRAHESVAGAREKLAAVVAATAARGGKVLIPAFAVGRTQELIYSLHELALEGRIPRMPIVIDSPLASAATDVFTRHGALFDANEPLVRRFRENPAGTLESSLVQFTESVDQSKEAMSRRGPMIVIAASGASDTRNTVLIVGFQAEHTLGRRIVERRPVIKVFGEEVPLRAHVEVLDGYSAHADHAGLLAWIESVRRTSPRLEHTWLVHGEPTAQDAFAEALATAKIAASCPTPGSRATL